MEKQQDIDYDSKEVAQGEPIEKPSDVDTHPFLMDDFSDWFSKPANRSQLKTLIFDWKAKNTDDKQNDRLQLNQSYPGDTSRSAEFMARPNASLDADKKSCDYAVQTNNEVSNETNKQRNASLQNRNYEKVATSDGVCDDATQTSKQGNYEISLSEQNKIYPNIPEGVNLDSLVEGGDIHKWEGKEEITQVTGFSTATLTTLVTFVTLVIEVLIFAAILSGCEWATERNAVSNFNDYIDALPSDDDAVVETLAIMREKYNCFEPDIQNLNWRFWPTFWYLFTVATSIGYGSFSPTTTWGRIVTVMFSFIGLAHYASFQNCLSGHLEAMIACMPYYPRDLTEKNAKLKQLCYKTVVLTWMLLLIIFVFLGAWIGNAIMGWDYVNTIYFSFVTVTTVGLGDFVWSIKKGAGMGIFFVIGGLLVFAEWYSCLIKLFKIMFRRLRGEQLVTNDFTAEEKKEVHDLVQEAKLVHVHDDCWSILAYLNEKENLGLDEDEINDLLMMHDRKGDRHLSDETWVNIIGPHVKSHDRQFHRSNLIACCGYWAAVYVCMFIGGLIISRLEQEGEKEDIRTWDNFLKRHNDFLTYEEKEHLTSIINHMDDAGVCSPPTCESWSDDNEDIFYCESYISVWDLSHAMFYCFTLMTTIGYGSFTAQTTGGRLFSVVYMLATMWLFGEASNRLLHVIPDFTGWKPEYTSLKSGAESLHKVWGKYPILCWSTIIGILITIVSAVWSNYVDTITWGESAWLYWITFLTVGLGDFTPLHKFSLEFSLISNFGLLFTAEFLNHGQAVIEGQVGYCVGEISKPTEREVNETADDENASTTSSL